jgi:hypothetical protein
MEQLLGDVDPEDLGFGGGMLFQGGGMDGAQELLLRLMEAPAIMQAALGGTVAMGAQGGPAALLQQQQQQQQPAEQQQQQPPPPPGGGE